MSSAINSKRQQLRKDIIKKQKQQLFMQKRREMIRNMRYPQGITNPVKDLRERNKVKQAFQFIRLKICESDYFQDLMKFMDQGLINVLIGYLHQCIQIQAVFQIIYLILDKNQFSFDKAFYQYGLIEYIFQYLNQSYKISETCMRILNIFTEKSVDYCQLLLQNSKHLTLIQYFMKRASYSRDPQEQNDNQGDKVYTVTLLVLENLITAKYESETYAQPKLQIFQFNLALLEKRLFLKQTIGILYECINYLQNSRQYFNLILVYINQLLLEANSQDRYLHNLFALIYNMISNSPIELTSFNQFVKLGIMTKKVNRPFIRILQIFTKNHSECLKSFPRDEFTWEKLFISTQNTNSEKALLILVEYFQIKSQWIWKYFAEALNSEDLSLQMTSIEIMNRLLKKSGFQQSILKYLHLHRIPTLLQRIITTQKIVRSNKNSNYSTLVQRASHLLEYILGPMTQESEHQENIL